MNRTYRLWYLLIVVLALAPAGARLFLWGMVRPLPVDMEQANAGATLFKHDWKPADPLAAGGDGLGPVYNATSCVACHNQAGPGGGGGVQHNVTTFTVRGPGKQTRQGVVHAFATGRPETLQDVDPSLPALSQPTLAQIVSLPGHRNQCLPFPTNVHLSQRNTPALFGSKLIDDLPERVILAGAKSQKMKWGMAPADDETVPVGRALRLANGRVGRFGWKAQMASLSDFVQAACANELGLGNPGQAQPVPIYEKVTTTRRGGLDLTLEQCNELTAFCASLPQPVERLPKNVLPDEAAKGKKLFTSVGCAECHTPQLGSVDGIYSDLLLHRMGQDLVGGGSYGDPPLPVPDSPGDDGPSPSEWRTAPLWGVADSAPYLHDGRAATLEEAIRMHGGQGQRSSQRFATLGAGDQGRLIAFLKTLRAP
jgi:CxxC motif-containing protein (DUF1111 family)